MKMTFLELFLNRLFKDPKLAENWTNLEENPKKSWAPQSSWNLFFPSLSHCGLDSHTETQANPSQEDYYNSIGLLYSVLTQASQWETRLSVRAPPLYESLSEALPLCERHFFFLLKAWPIWETCLFVRGVLLFKRPASLSRVCLFLKVPPLCESFPLSKKLSHRLTTWPNGPSKIQMSKF